MSETTITLAPAGLTITCPLCHKTIAVKDGMAWCNHYPLDAKILIESERD